MPDRCWLRGLVVVPGAHTYPQAELARKLRDEIAALPGTQALGQTVGFVFEHSEIRQRHLEVPLELIAGRRDWYRLVNEATESLAVRALRAMVAAGERADDCDGLVVVTSSYAGFPGLSRRLQEALGIARGALSFDLAALGCAGPTHGLFLAHTLLQRGACRKVCVVCADAMGTHGQCRRHASAPTMEQVVAHCLASDGASALVLAAEPGEAPRLAYRDMALSSHLWPESLDLNDFTADADNQPFISVGRGIRDRIAVELGRVLDDQALASPVLLHPGGAALMRLVRERFPALAESATLSMRVLAENGNVGSPSVLWVLARALDERLPVTPRARLVALGPGIATTVLRLDGTGAGAEA